MDSMMYTDYFNKEDLYNAPSCKDIKGNIAAKQGELLINLLDMGFVASNAEDSFVISPPVKQVHSPKHRESYEAQYEANREEFNQNFKRNISLSRKLDKKVELRNSLFNEIKSVYPNFCKDIDKKISEKDLLLYRNQKKLLKNVLSLNYNSNTSYNSFNEELLSYKDRLAQVIDTEEFSMACNIEDNFIVSEIDKFMEILQELPKEESRRFTKKHIKLTPNDEPISIVDLANRVKKERLERIKKYSHIQELYEKMKKHSKIDFRTPKNSDEKSI